MDFVTGLLNTVLIRKNHLLDRILLPVLTRAHSPDFSEAPASEPVQEVESRTEDLELIRRDVLDRPCERLDLVALELDLRVFQNTRKFRPQCIRALERLIRDLTANYLRVQQRALVSLELVLPLADSLVREQVLQHVVVEQRVVLVLARQLSRHPHQVLVRRYALHYDRVVNQCLHHLETARRLRGERQRKRRRDRGNFVFVGRGGALSGSVMHIKLCDHLLEHLRRVSDDFSWICQRLLQERVQLVYLFLPQLSLCIYFNT